MKSHRWWLAGSVALALVGGCSRGNETQTELAEELHAARSRVTAYKPEMPALPSTRPVVPVAEPYIQVWTVRETVADALGRIGEDAVPGLIEALSVSDPGVREHAARALSLIGPKAVAAVPALVKLLHDDSEPVRRQAARALGQIGPAAKAAIPDLLKVLEEEPAASKTDERAPAVLQDLRPQARKE